MMEDRISLVERIARARGVDVSDDLAVVRAARDRCARRLDAIERRLIDGPSTTEDATATSPASVR